MVLFWPMSHPFLAIEPTAGILMPIEHQPTGAFVIRPAGRKDAAAIAEVHTIGWEVYRGLLPDVVIDARTVATRTAEWDEYLGTNKHPLLLAFDKGDMVVGFVHAQPPRSAADESFDCEISHLYLLPAARGVGLGRQLMAVVAEAALQRGWRKAILRVYAGNPAEGFYRALGGRYDGMRQHAIDGHAVRSLAFAWDDVASLLSARPTAG
jgi:GNAT superfamily N-acetyltransferase